MIYLFHACFPKIFGKASSQGCNKEKQNIHALWASEKKDHRHFQKIKVEVSSASATSFSQLKIRNYCIFDVFKLIQHSFAINILFCRKLFKTDV